MTKEELEKEANDYADKHSFRVPYDGSNKFYDDVDFKASKDGYIAGAEPREKQIEELEAQNKQLTLKLDALEGETPWKDPKDKSELIKENTELKEQVEKMRNFLEQAYNSLCSYELNINGINVTITAESEKKLFVDWMKNVMRLIGKEQNK